MHIRFARTDRNGSWVTLSGSIWALQNSVVAFLENGKPQVMQNAEGNRTTPPLCFTRRWRGDAGRRIRQAPAPDGTQTHDLFPLNVCRLPLDESEDRRRGIAYELALGPEGLVGVKLDGRVLLPSRSRPRCCAK